jgi:hypothetical protein
MAGRNKETYEVNHAVQMLEPLLLENTRIHIIFEMPVIERQPDAVQLEASEKFGVLLGEMVLQPLVEEELVVLLAKHGTHGLPVLGLVAGEAGDEILHAAR